MSLKAGKSKKIKDVVKQIFKTFIGEEILVIRNTNNKNTKGLNMLKIFFPNNPQNNSTMVCTTTRPLNTK